MRYQRDNTQNKVVKRQYLNSACRRAEQTDGFSVIAMNKKTKPDPCGFAETGLSRNLNDYDISATSRLPCSDSLTCS